MRDSYQTTWVTFGFIYLHWNIISHSSICWCWIWFVVIIFAIDKWAIMDFNGVFPKWNANSMNSVNLINHWSMNQDLFKYLVSHMCLAGAVVALWFLTQEMAGLNPFAVMRNIFVIEFSEFRENYKTQLLSDKYLLFLLDSQIEARSP